MFGGVPIHTRRSGGSPFVLNVWASWCPNCRTEHPLLGDLASAVPLYGLNYRDKGDAACAWLTGRRATPIAPCWPTPTADCR